MSFNFKTPIVFIIFNRPDKTREVFEKIREAKPLKLFVIADGPRKEIKDDKWLCIETREVIRDIDWECEVHTNFSEVNLGCKNRVSSGLDWVFKNVEEAIILEDDCVPDLSFFQFCQELLEKYRDDKRVMMISGNNFLDEELKTDDSYYFSIYTHIWGWATWQRAWKLYDSEMELWPSFRDQGLLRDIHQNVDVAIYWFEILNNTYFGKIETWDYAWMFTCWRNNGLSILPNINLVKNIGFGPNATHTKSNNTRSSNLSSHRMAFPLMHPRFITRNKLADDFTSEIHFGVMKKHREFRDSINGNKVMWLDFILGQDKGITHILKDYSIKNICIFGTSDIGKYLIADLTKENFNIVSFIDNFIINKKIKDIPVNSTSWLIKNKDKIDCIIVSIEGKHDKAIISDMKKFLGEKVLILSWKELIYKSVSTTESRECNN